MKNYKIVASDLDGTLLNDQMQVSEENARAIAEMSSRGVFFVPASGRTLAEFDPLIRDHSNVRYIIHSDGAVVYDKQTGNRNTACMPHDLSVRVMQTLAEYECAPSVRWNGKAYADAAQHNDEVYTYHRMGRYFRELYYRTAIAVDHLTEYCCELDELEMVSAFFRHDEELLECKRRLEDTGELVVVSSASCSMEIHSIHAGKGKALHRLADMLGLSPSQTIAVGDSGNDRSMIEAAGLGLAVRNASEDLKAIAKAVICSNNEHAIEYILKNYL